ncbi:MAG: sortase [Patescibacteria group bacterium]
MELQYQKPIHIQKAPFDAFLQLVWERPMLMGTLWLSFFIILFTISWFFGIVPPLETSTVEQDAETITPVVAAEVTNDTPVRIIIDAIGVDTKINNPTGTSIATLDAALLTGAVHYPGSGDLEDTSNMFLFGHSTGFRVVQNESFKAFNNLDDLSANDIIRVRSDSHEYLYRVTNVSKTKAEDALVELSNREKKLTLTTCDSFGSKEDRFVVEADFVGSYPIVETID